MEAFGTAAEDIEKTIAVFKAGQPDIETFTVYSDNWEAWEVFRRVNSQWDRNHFTGAILALKYEAVTSVINLMVKRKKRIEILDAVRLIESGFLDNQSNGKL